jgi:HSP20 family protein
LSTLQQLQNGINRAWDNLTEGWQHLRQRASHALTKFNPVRRGGQLETAEEQALERGARWALLAAEVRENDDEVLVKLEAPGMQSEDFDIQVTDDILVVRGEKHFERSEKRGELHIMECAYGSFERAIPLPAAVDEGAATAKYRRGILQIRLPKSQAARKRRIEVGAG